MKIWTIAKSSLGVTLAALPLVGGCVQESASSEPTIVVAENDPAPGPDQESAVATNAPPPEAAVKDLETAPARIVSTPPPATQTANLNPTAAEVAKLAQSGVDENVMLAFVTNSSHTFNLSSDQIIYLNDIGVPGNVVTAMIQHDQTLVASSTPPPQPAAPVYSSPPPAAEETQPATTAVAEAPLTPPANEPANVNVTSSYFYDSLAPYGNWIDVEGYGRCWQPTVVVVDRSWTPYCNRGHWVYSDCGWYWASDYSWGWAPFHYGRWFRHGVWGWCWAPDTVWGPSWVSWRYSPGYCGWAPLPPTACYRPGFGFTYYGRSVGADFSFGLGIGFFTFVGSDHFCDSHLSHYRVPHDHVTRFYHNTTVINPVVDRHDNPRFHKGIPPREIAAATHTDIKPVRIHDTPDIPRGNRGEHMDRDRGTLTVFRPHLPDPPARHPETRVGEGIKPATPITAIPNFASDNRMNKGVPRQSTETTGFADRGRNLGGRQNDPAAQQNDSRGNNSRIIRQPGVAQQIQTQPGGGENLQTRNGQTRFDRTPALNNREPRDPRITRGHPEMMTQPNARSSQPVPAVTTKSSSDSTSRANQPQRNELLLNRREQQQQFNAQPRLDSPRNTPQSQPPTLRNENQPGQFQQRDQRVFHQDTPRFQQPDQRVITQPPAPVQRQPEPRVFQQRSQPSFAPPAPERSAPVIRSQPSPAPQMQAPQRAPAVRQNDSGGGGGGRQSGNDGQRGGGQRGGGRQR